MDINQFAAIKNPPWARNNEISAPNLAVANQNVGPVGVPGSLLNHQSGVVTPSMFSLGSISTSISQPHYTNQQQLQHSQLPPSAIQQLHLANLTSNSLSQTTLLPASSIPQPGIAIPTSLATTQVSSVSYPPRSTPQGHASNHRIFTGTVTKLHDNFGFVDEEVFFQTSCVKGAHPKLNDRVLVEASFNANMPFKWNATRIQALPSQVSSTKNNSNSWTPQPVVSAPSQAPPPLMTQSAIPSGGRQNQSFSHRNRQDFSLRDHDKDREKNRIDRKNDRFDRYDRRSPKFNKSPTRIRSPHRSKSPIRIRRKTSPRYSVQIPKVSLDLREANVVTLRSRYSNLYLPSDFFNASTLWAEAFPAHRPFNLGQHCSFSVMHKEVNPLVTNDAILEPSDADHLYSAKVMLLACPQMQHIYHKSCGLSEDTSDLRDSFQHPTRLLQFLVGLKGRNEPMAIGGPWSPSLDGLDPARDPSVLIKTAIRTTKALTGIDLSVCTQWYRFLEIRYHRPEELHKGCPVASRVETVVIFMPDVWTSMPTSIEWKEMTIKYKKQLEDKLSEETKDDSQEEEDEENASSVENKDPLHWSQIDPRIMKIPELRRELDARGLPNKGLRSQLMARLIKSTRSEQEKEEEEENQKEIEEDENETEASKAASHEKEDKKKKEELDKKAVERERITREKRYLLGDNAAIIVHPSALAKNGKFDCSNMSLSVLLDYRQEDNKEHSFEVSLFAELFNEMLMRDAGIKIYTALLNIPDKKEDDKKNKKDKKDKKNNEKEEQKKDQEEKKEKNTENEESEEPPNKRKKPEKNSEKDNKESDENSKKEVDNGNNHESETEDDDKRRIKDKKMDMNDPDLLLAFVYFDVNHTGYLIDKDLEEIFNIIGLYLSRAQIKKLVQKVITKDALMYRKLTDNTVAFENSDIIANEIDSISKISQISSNSQLGNKHLVPSFATRDEKISTDKESSCGTSDVPEDSKKYVQFNGSVIDIENTIKQLEKSDKDRISLKNVLQNLQNKYDELTKDNNSYKNDCYKLKNELSELKQNHKELNKDKDEKERSLKLQGNVIQDTIMALSNSIANLEKANKLDVFYVENNVSTASKEGDHFNDVKKEVLEDTTDKKSISSGSESSVMKENDFNSTKDKNNFVN